jgi:RHS repeat-associated protein
LADANDLLSITFLSDTVAINGRSYVSTYSSATRTSTDTTPTGRETVTTIDLSGRVTQRQFLGLLPTGFGYDSRGFLTSLTRASGAEARTTSFGYTDDGRLATIMDPVGRSISFSYDAAGQLTQTTLPGSRVITYGYDQDGDLTSLKPPGQPAHTYAYTPVYLEAEYTPPDAGAGANSTQYAYDADRKITRLSLPGGGRPLTVTVPGGQITYAYDSQTGNLTMVTAPDGGTISYGYDGTLPTATTWAGTVSGSVNRAYDTSFRLSSFRVNGGHGIALQYDSDGLATGAGDLALSRAPQSGLITGTTLGGVADSRTYSGLGELVSYEASFNSTSIYRVEYTRDKLGRIAEERETTGGVTETWTYAYDLSGALAEVRKNGAPVVTYTYDANGNRLTCTGPGGTITGDYDDQDRLTQYGSTSYSYTDNGELLSKTANGWTTTYQYDALGSLRAVVPASGSRIDYVIDGTNRRIGKRADGVLTQSFLYLDGLRPVAELDGDDIVVSLFVYACQAHVPDYVIKAGTVYPIISDHLGSPRLVVNTQTGEIVQRLDSDAFGDVVLDTNPRFQPFGFAGGLVRSGLRDYDAKTGRWTAKDPLGFDGDSTNQYRYVLNDPVNAIDPCGVVETNPEAIRETLWALAHEEQRIGGWANMKAAYAEVDITEHALFGDSAMRYYGKPWPWDPKPYERVMAAGGRFLPFRDLNINSWKTQALGLRTELDLRWFVHGYLSGVPMYCIKVGVGVAYNVKTGRGLWSEGAETNLKSLALGQVVRWWGMDLTDFAQMVSGGPPANPRDYTKGSMFPPD